MSTMVYAPGIKVYIDSYKLGQIVDVSADLTGASMQRRSDGVSQFQFGLINPLRKYDNVFTPNDRIVVVMKRLTWMRTFTGYLNQVPIFSSWPRDVSMSASCSLKRLQYYYWDPEIAASQDLVRNSMRLTQDGSPPDGGIKQAVINLLERVVDWSGSVAFKDPSLAGSKIHIGSIPKNWFDFAAKVLKEVGENVLEEGPLAEELLKALGGVATIAGVAAATDGTVASGEFASTKLTEKQAANATKILGFAFAAGATRREAEQTIACALVESVLIMYASDKYKESLLIEHDRIGSDYDSVGFFQQRPSQGWGTIAQCMDPKYSTEKFLSVLKGIKNRESLPFGDAVAMVQRPRADLRYKYGTKEADARAIVTAYLAGTRGTTNPTSADAAERRAAAGAASSSPTAVSNPNNLPKHGVSTAAQLIQVAQQAVAARSIPYVFGSPTRYDNPDPKSHDCSSFTQWVYYQSLGSLNGMPRNSSAQYEWCKNNGGREITVEEGIRTPGALLFRGRDGLKIGHVEYSLGDGRCIGTRSKKYFAGIVNTRAGAWTFAALPPAIEYPNRPATVASLGDPVSTGGINSAFVSNELNARNELATTLTSGGGGPNAQIDSLFGSVAWENAPSTVSGLAEALEGIRALQNDSPILPYIKNLLNSTMRQFCSAPNGDFIAWFPDYFGIWGTAAKMVLQPIEVRDFTVTWNDEYLVTHQYVSRTHDGNQQLNLSTGEVTALEVIYATESFGIATIDQPSVMGVLFGLDSTPDEARKFRDFMYNRFGPRPNYTQIPGISGFSGEFFMALFLFMQNWTSQYNANIDVTFMPEIYPGMLIQFPEYNFQAYVNTVEHSIAFGPGGGFKTTVNIQAPARINDTGSEDKMTGLPIAGKRGPGSPVKGRSATPPKDKGKPVVNNPRLERLR